MKQIPNLFTLLNLLFGTLALVFILQTGETIVVLDNTGVVTVVLPEKIWLGALFLFAAAVVDFLDGFLARLMKAQSGMGAQLDSLSDMVSFGVAPGMLLYQLLRLSYAQEDNGLDVSIVALLPAFIFTLAAAWRLARFNISNDQSTSFRGVPTPAAGLVVASLPLILWYYEPLGKLILNRWLLYGFILVMSWLMVSRVRLMALKFTSYSFGPNAVKYVLVLLSLVCIVWLHWRAVPLIFLLYLVCSAVEGRSSRVGGEV